MSMVDFELLRGFQNTYTRGIMGGRMAMAGWLGAPPIRNRTSSGSSYTHSSNHNEDHIRYVETLHLRFSVRSRRCWVGPLRTARGVRLPVYCNSDIPNRSNAQSTGIQVYSEVERLVTEIVKQSQHAWGEAHHWSEVEGAWVLGPRHSRPWSIVHFIGGIFVGAAPQLAYRLFLERLCEKGILVIATPYASGFDHFLIADEVQFKFDRCLRAMQEPAEELPIFGIGHSLGSVIHLLIGSRYAVNRNGNILMAFNNKDASVAMPFLSPILVPMAQSIAPILSQITSSPTIRIGAEMTLKQLENLSPPIMKQVLPLVQQLPPLYMDLAKGRDYFSPRPEETQRLVKSYYGVTRNLLIKYKDDPIDETPALAQLLSANSAISSMLDLSIRTVPGDHGMPLRQALPDVPPAMVDAVYRGSELLANLASGTPWETVARDVSSTLGIDSRFVRVETAKDLDHLVDVISSWMSSCAGSNLLRT